MNDMIERAAKAIADKWLEKADDATARVGPPVIARAALLAALDPEDEELAWLAGKALYNSAADRAGRYRPDIDMRPFEQQSDDMQRAWKQDGAAVIAALKAASQGDGQSKDDPHA